MSRMILKVSGRDAQSFLQGLVSNDVTRLAQGPVYAAMLSPQGKYLADFLMIESDGAILIDTAASHGPALLQRLSMYKLRADVTLEQTDLRVSRGTGPAPHGALADPRHPALGWRLYGATGGDDGSDWDAIRVAHCIPETGIELTPETYILEAGFERLNGVDFRKGCYVGQEVTARMKHKTTLKKGLVTLGLEGRAPVGTAIDSAGKPAGTLFTQSGARAIAHMRHDRIAAEMTAGDARLYPLAETPAPQPG